MVSLLEQAIAPTGIFAWDVIVPGIALITFLYLVYKAVLKKPPETEFRKMLTGVPALVSTALLIALMAIPSTTLLVFGSLQGVFEFITKILAAVLVGSLFATGIVYIDSLIKAERATPGF